MPQFDGTGPQGQGPKTGRGVGDCEEKKENNSQDSENNLPPRGQGVGRGRCLRRWWPFCRRNRQN